MAKGKAYTVQELEFIAKSVVDNEIVTKEKYNKIILDIKENFKRESSISGIKTVIYIHNLKQLKKNTPLSNDMKNYINKNKTIDSRVLHRYLIKNCTDGFITVGQISDYKKLIKISKNKDIEDYESRYKKIINTEKYKNYIFKENINSKNKKYNLIPGHLYLVRTSCIKKKLEFKYMDDFNLYFNSPYGYIESFPKHIGLTKVTKL